MGWCPLWFAVQCGLCELSLLCLVGVVSIKGRSFCFVGIGGSWVALDVAHGKEVRSSFLAHRTS